MVPRNIKPEDIVAVNRIIDNGNNYEYGTKSFGFDYLDSAKKKYGDDPEVREKVNQIMPGYKKVWEEETGLRFKKKVDQTQTPEFKKWFEGSKVVNEDGTPKIMYHGTPNKGFNIFNEGGYFTENKDYADKYQNPDASSIKFGKKATNPGTYAVYLDIKKPFDTRDAKAREIFEEEYYGHYGMGTPLGDKGLPDWMDGTDLMEFIQENHPEYDGLILDEGGVGGYGEKVQDRGLSYVPFKSNQIKSATDNIGTFDKNNPDIRYKKGLQKKESGLEKKDIRYKLNDNGWTPTTDILEEDAKEIKTKGIGFLKTKDNRKNIDNLKRIKSYVKAKLGIDIPDGIKIERRNIKHVLEDHGNDTELGIGKSMTYKKFEDIPTILTNYNRISIQRHTDNGKVVNRIKLEMDKGNDTRTLVLEIQGNNQKSPNQLGLVTMYEANPQEKANFDGLKRYGDVDAERERGREEFGNKYLEN